MIGKTQLMNALQGHIGALNGISVLALATELRVSEREVRHLVTELREDGTAVCGHPSAGYFIAANDEELERYCITFLRARAMHSLHLICRLKNIAMPDLLGQMKLKT